MRRLLEPAFPLAAAAAGIGLGLLYIEEGIGLPAILVGVAIALILVGVGVGRALFPRRPRKAGLLMEVGLLLPLVLAAVAGAFLLWLAIEEGPGANATTREKEVYSAFSAAIATYLGAVILEPEQPLWNPVKRAIKSVFAESFKDRADALEKDARDAQQEDSYSASAPAEHPDDVVEGWGWDARRIRTRHIQDQLDRRRP